MSASDPLVESARRAREYAVATFSGFKVGAALQTEDGQIISGCNVENASYGLCNCAERTAIFTAAAAGERRILAVAVFTPTAQPTSPCGACRQVINEFGPTALVISVCASTSRHETTLDRLLPGAFGPDALA